MEIDLAGTKHGVSERFVPDKDLGRLIEAEHLARYRWAAQAADGLRVLDAGCGTAYGTRLLAEAGAREVVGTDIAEGVLGAAASRMPDNVRLEAADLNRLPFEDRSFDLIVCFEVLEHFDDPFAVLDELCRVLSPEGALIVSSPNGGVFPGGNPHHHHEFQPDELRAALLGRLANVELIRQHDYLLSAVFGDDVVRRRNGEMLDGVRIDKLVSEEPGSELYTLAIAGNGELPELRPLGTLTGTLEFREWLSVYDTQTDAIRDKDNYIGELEARVAERDELAQLLVDAEQRLAEIPSLRLQVEDLRQELAGARAAEEEVRRQIKTLDDRLMDAVQRRVEADQRRIQIEQHVVAAEERVARAQQTLEAVMGSPSWRLTRPLRAAKKLLRR